MGFLKRREKTVKAGAQVTIDKKVLEQALLTPVKFGKKPVLAEAAMGEYADPKDEIGRILGTPGARPTQITGEVSSDKLDVLSSPAPGVDVKVEFASVFRLATENRAMITFDKVIEGLAEAQFNEEQIQNFKINEVIFEPILDGKGKPVKEGDKIVYKLKEGYEWVKNFLTPEQIKLGDITFEALIETVKTKASLTKESIESFERALYGQVKGGGKNVEQEKKLEAFLTDVLDGNEIAENFGAGLQEYNPYVNIPVPVLAMHAVMSTGVLELLNNDGKPNKSEANIEQKIAALISGIPNESLRKLVEQVIGYKVVGDTIKPLTMEEDKFKDLRGSMLTKMVKRAKSEKVRDGSIVEPAILAQAKNLHDLHGKLVARGFIPQGSDFEDKKRARINVLKNEFMLSLSPEQRKTYVSVFAAQDAEARMQYINAYMKGRRREAVTAYGKVVGLDETKTKDLLVRFGVEEPDAEIAGKKGKKQEVQMPFFGELNGIVSNNIVLLSEMQQAVISSAGTYMDGVPAENIAKYREQEEILLRFNGAVLDMIEARDAAAIAHEVANTIKLDKIEEAIDESGLKDAKDKVSEADKKVKEAKEVLQDKEKKALTARIEYVFAGLELYINTTLNRMSLPPNVMDSKKEEYRKRLLECIKTTKGKEPYIDEEELKREYVNCFSKFAKAVANMKKEAFNSATVTAEATSKFEASQKKIIEIEAMDYDKLVEHERGLLPEGLYDQLESTDPTVSANAQDTLNTTLPTMNIVARREYMLVNALRKVKEAEKNLQKKEADLHEAKSKLQTLHYDTYHIGLGKVKLEEVILKLPALEELLVTLETSKNKIAELDFDKLIDGLDLNKEQKARLKENVKTLKENKAKFIKQLDAMIESLKEQITQMKSDLGKQYDIVEVTVPGSDRKRIVLIDNPRKIIELQEKGYIVDGKRVVSFTEQDYAIHPTAIKIANLRYTIEHGGEKEKKAAQAELDTVVASMPKDKPSRDKILRDVVRIERYERIQTTGKNPQYKDPLTTSEVSDDMVVLEVDVETKTVNGKGTDVVSTKSIEQLGEQLGVEISKEEKIQNIKDRVISVSNDYNALDISAVDAGTLRTFIDKCKDALEGADNPDYAIELKKFELVGILRERLTAAERRLAELEAARDAKEVVVGKVTSLAIIDVATADMTTLTGFIEKAQVILKEIDNTTKFKAIVEAEEIIEYKNLLDVLKAAQEKTLDPVFIKSEKIKEIQNNVKNTLKEYKDFDIAEAGIDDLKAFITKVEQALEDVDNPEYTTELSGFAPIIELKARLQVAKGRVAELETSKTSRDIVIEKIKAITIPEKIAEITDLAVLSTFVTDAEKLCKELNDNPEWKDDVLAAEEPPEYKALTEALAAAKERVKELSTDASATPPVSEDEVPTATYTTDDVHLFVDSVNLINAYNRLTDPKTDAITRRQTLIELGLDASKINEDGFAIEGDADVVRFQDALATKLEEATNALTELRTKLPKEDGPEKDKFLKEATAYAKTKVTDSSITEARITDGLDKALYGMHHPDPVDESEVEVDDFDVAEEREPVKIKQPSFTDKGLETAIKSAGKLLKNVKSDLAKAKSAIAAKKKVYNNAILRQGYTRLLLNALLKENGIESVPTPLPDTMDYEREVGEPTGSAYDTYVVIKYLKVVADVGVCDPETGMIVATDKTGKSGSAEDVIYDSIEICEDSARKPKATRRQQILHRHLHTIATKEAIQKGADMIGAFLTSQKIDITPENITALINGTLTKDGNPVKLPPDIKDYVTTAARTAKEDAPLPETVRTR